MSRTVKLLRKIVVAAIGIPLFVIGIILIPLPGPGLLVCFLALFILSFEFEWVKPHMERIKKQLKKITDQAKGHQNNQTKKNKKP